MTSDDVSRIESLLREHFVRTEKQLSDMRADNAEFHVQMMKDFNVFTEKIDNRITKFEDKVDDRITKFEERVDSKIEKLDERITKFEERVDAKIEALDNRITKFEEKVDARFEKVDARFERLEAKVVDMQNDMTGLKHDVGNLQTWNYWTLSIIISAYSRSKGSLGCCNGYSVFSCEGIPQRRESVTSQVYLTAHPVSVEY